MHTTLQTFLMRAAVGLAVVGLGACGGGSGDGGDPAMPTPPAGGGTVPDAAVVSTDALTDWAGTLAADDDSEPMSLAGVELPVSETEDAATLGR